MNTNMLEPTAIESLRSTLSGSIIGPEDEGYDKARTVVTGMVDKHPALIVRADNDDDVVRVIAFAREQGLELAVRSGGHSGAGHSVTEGGVVLDLSGMRALEIDPEGRTAWAESGLTAGEYSKAAAEYGLATGFGDTGSVGIGGITLGGGVGYLVRKYGLTIDDLLAADIVTADGQKLRVDAENHPDLFWAIRGGGGNFGVVTRFKFRLHDLSNFVGGILILPATPDSIAEFVAAAENAPEELSTIGNIMPAPPMPFIAPEHHGKMVILGMMAYAGDAESGQHAIAPFRAIDTPLADMVRPMPYYEIYPPDDEEYHPVAAARNMFLNKVDREVAQVIIDNLKASTGDMAVTQLRVLGGAYSRVPSDATAFAHRDSKIMANLATLYHDRNDDEKHEAWVNNFMAALNQGDNGVYVNFLVDEGEKRIQDAYPGETWQRLTEIKRRYDPNNLFRLNQNIPPAA